MASNKGAIHMDNDLKELLKRLKKRLPKLMHPKHGQCQFCKKFESRPLDKVLGIYSSTFSIGHPPSCLGNKLLRKL